MNHLMLLLNSVFVLSSVLMVLTWYIARRLKNYSIVDAVWAFGFFLVSVLLLVLAEGWTERKWLMVTVVSIWSLRLGLFLARRIARHHPHEDNRYLELRKSYGESVEKGFFWFFQYQAWSIFLLSIPFVVMSMNKQDSIHFLEWLGAVITVLAVLGEGIADHQKSTFKSVAANRGKNCEVGLWRYSRHPNYFFESVVWFGIFLMIVPSPGGLFCFYVPLLMLYLLMKVTGVPMSEENSMKVYGDSYLEYQKKVSFFVPWFRKK